MSRKENLLKEVTQHYQMWTKDNEKRMTRVNGWNDITDAYYGVLPKDWPYMTRIVDPRIRTSLLEKNARLINSKLRGRLVPREGADVATALINNAVLDYQWDSANDGGSMLTKISISDLDARLYQSKFALIKWRYEERDGKLIFDGNEMAPLDIRDCGMDSTASHIKNANWFQHRVWVTYDELENESDNGGGFKNLDKLKETIAKKLATKKSSSKNEYVPRLKQLKGLEDRTGEDMAFPVIKIVTEYRRDRWITFAPDQDLILRDIPNPYAHGKIPVAQLRYYAIQDDPLGESEVEPVLPIWKAIQATICGYLDEVMLKMRPPLKVIENAARVETIQYGPEAQWLVDRQDAIEEMKSSGDSLAYFQTTYQALVAAFNTAMGDSSQGISNFGPFEQDKTATEIKQSARQQLTRDQKNQIDLGEFITDIMLMWLSNNKQFLFSDPEKREYIQKIIGADQFSKFERLGMAESELMPEAANMIADIIEQNPNMSELELNELVATASIPKYPVVLNPKEKDPTKLKIKAKMIISPNRDSADISVVPEDMEGTFDYIPDIKSMSIGAGEEQAMARQNAIALFTNNPVMLQLLQADGYRPNAYELAKSELDSSGLGDAERFFVKLNDQQIQQTTTTTGGLGANSGLPGLPTVPQAPIGAGVPQQMAGPNLL